jgi:lysophospholipase L1-like esterase
MKKTLIFAFSVSIFFAFIITACDNGNSPENYDTRPIVCLGTSMTSGLPGQPNISYPANLQNKVKVEVINAGIWGDTISNALSRINTDVLSRNPQIVIIECGANGVASGISPEMSNDAKLAKLSVNLGNIQNSLQQIIDKLKGGNCKLYLVKWFSQEMIFSIADQLTNDNTFKNTFYTQLDSLYSNMATSNNIDVIAGIWDGIWGIHMYDSIHADATGRAMMADNIFNAMRPYLGGNNLIK